MPEIPHSFGMAQIQQVFYEKKRQKIGQFCFEILWPNMLVTKYSNFFFSLSKRSLANSSTTAAWPIL